MRIVEFICGIEWAKYHLSIISFVFMALTISPICSQTLPPHRVFLPHNQGNLQLVMSNSGVWGVGDIDGVRDPFTGELIKGITYPRNSGVMFPAGSISVGAKIGSKTLVTDLQEFWPDIAPLSDFKLSSIDRGKSVFSEDAFSELDMSAVFYDTLIISLIDSFDKRRHIPIGIRIKQRSMAWSGPNLDDFIIITFELGNIGGHFLKDVYVSLEGTAGAFHEDNVPGLFDDKALSGFLKTWPSPEGCGFIDTVMVAYGMDNDGDPKGNGQWDRLSARGAFGFRVLGMPSDSLDLNYNWWAALDFGGAGFQPPSWGPRLAHTDSDPFRKLGSSYAAPEGDASTYYVMSHKEFDYDQMYSAIDFSGQGWMRPTGQTPDVASGMFSNYTLSFGPFDLRPNAATNFTIALVAGDSVHVNPTDYADLWDPRNPSAYYQSLDFSSLALNSRWASWVYDNPGVDTDGDGFFGKFRMCDGDTFWYEGDGVPDFRADVPPPSPEVTVIPSEAKLAVRWNGYFSETNIDPFTRTKDFEGYRVYLGLDDRSSSLSIISSFDNLNYNRFRLVKRPNGRFDWVNNDLPFTIDSLRILFNDPNFDPLNWTRTNPLTFNDTLFRFEKQDFNRSDLLSRSGIHKVFPNAIDPGPDTLFWNDSDLVFDHDRPLPKFYEYELIVNDLLPTVRQYVSVTAFDFGFSAGNIPAKESNKLNNITEAFARTSVDTVESKNLDVYIYPNPYRIDGNLIGRGLENRDGTQANQRAHRVHFVNLPRVCKITIYSLDGDRIDSFDHNFPEGGPEAMHDEWDMITRNGLIPVSGIYYWVVEAETRTQMGKLIIIK